MPFVPRTTVTCFVPVLTDETSMYSSSILIQHLSWPSRPVTLDSVNVVVEAEMGPESV